jgi:hypothetical protein
MPELRPVLGFYGVVTPQCIPVSRNRSIRWDLFDFEGKRLTWGFRRNWSDAWESVRKAAKLRARKREEATA